MKSLKRILASLTVVCMLASLFSMTFVQAAETDYTFSNAETTVSDAYGSVKKIDGPEGFNISKADFENSDSLLVFSYDAYIPDSTDTKQTIYSYLRFDGNGITGKYFALGSKLAFNSGNRNFYGFNYSEATVGGTSNKSYLTEYGYNARMLFNNTTDTSGGQWTNLKTVVKYDSTKKAYVSTNYINGRAILVADKESAVLTFKPDDNWLKDAENRTGIKYTIGVRCGDTGASDKDIKIANIGLNVYSETEFEKTIEVASGANEVTVPVTNAKFKNDATAPAEVKGGLIDVSKATVTAVNKGGAEVSGVKAENAAVMHSKAVSVADGSAFKISGLPALKAGDVLKVKIDGAIGVGGAVLSPIELILYGTGTEQKIIYSLKNSDIDKNTKKINVKVDAEKLFNNEDASGSAKIICASYNTDGVLLGVNVNNLSFSDTDFKDGKYQYTNDIGFEDGTKDVKIFLFNDMNGIVPLIVCQPLSSDQGICRYDIRNNIIKAYMNDSYDSAQKYCDATIALDRPQKITFKLNVDGMPISSKGYILEISEKSDMSDAWVFESDSEYIDVYNFKTGTDYYQRITSKSTGEKSDISGFSTIAGAPRTIYASGVRNIRDLGGWNTSDNRTVKQGNAYRSYRLTDEKGNSDITRQGIQVLRDQLHIRTEIDFRADSETTTAKSILGDDINYIRIPLNYQNDYLSGNKAAIKQIIELFADKNNYPIIYHCSAGADRTGMISYLLNGLCGVGKEQLLRDYFLTNFSQQSTYRDFNKISGKYVKTLDAYHGENLNEKIYNYLKEEIGVSDENLNAIIDNMVDR